MTALALACALVAARAHATDSAVAQADRLFKDGRHAAERGDFAHACKLFEDSFRLDPGVGTLINLGDCAEHLGDLERAYTSYHTAVARMYESDDRAARVRARLESIEQHAAKIAIHLGEDAPQGTVVTVDGAVVDSKGAPLHLAKGPHAIRVTAVGYRGARYDVDVAEGETRAFNVSPGSQLEAVLPTSLPESGSSSANQPGAHGAAWMKPAAIATLGLGVASVWVGSLAGMMAIDRRDIQSGQCNAQGLCTQTGVDAAHEGATWATVSTATFIAGGALVALGATLLVVSLASHKSVTVGLGGPGLLVAGTFR